MLQRFTRGCVLLMQRYLPDAFLFAVVLTFLTFLLGVLVTGQGVVDMAMHWGDGMWSLLGFSMQMALVLVTGHTLAKTPLVAKGLRGVASLAKSPESAIVLVSLVSAVACWLNWGFGLMVGALLARELARRVPGVDYRLLIASAYSGFIVWHGGISASIPLTLATPTVDLAGMTAGAITSVVPTTKTIFSASNLLLSATIILMLPFVNRLMHPKGNEVVTITEEALEALRREEAKQVDATKKDAVAEGGKLTPAQRLENSRWIVWLLFGLMALYLTLYFVRYGFALDLNVVILIFLSFGILFHRTPRQFLDSFQDAVRGSAGIILQFPFYAGIMGMMVGANAEGASLAGMLSQWFVNISGPRTLPLYTFLSAGIVNIFVPSGGGQWAVQAPIMMPASVQLGVDTAKTAMAIAWGDAWTNMIQPFWALPALGIAGLNARDIMGFCVVNLLLSGVVISLFMLWV